jgi:HK97 family phage major capsid protein
MSYSNVVSRTDAQALVNEVVSTEILQNLQTESAALRLFRRIPISTNQTRFPVISALPTAYFVNGDTGLKQTTEVNWTNKYINVEELAAIVPVPEAVFEDASYDVWAAIRPLLEQAIGRALDAAIFFGANKPASWPGAIVTDAGTAANARTIPTSTQATGGIGEDLNQLFALVEADGFDVNGIVASRTFRAKLRSARDTTGQKLLDISANGDSVEGVPISYAMRGLWPSGTGTAVTFVGDFSQGIIGVRRDMTLKMLDQAVIQDAAGGILYNLAQQDMVAARLTFRVGFAVANTLNYDNANAATRYPWAVGLNP